MENPRITCMEYPWYALFMSERYSTIIKTWSPESRGTITSSVVVTQHAIERCQQRVAPSLSRDEAHALLLAMLSRGRSRATPRKWTKGSVSPTQKLRFVYWSELPDVCGLVVDHTLVTVVTRPMCRRQRPAVLPRSNHIQQAHNLGFTARAAYTAERDEDDV